MKQFIQDKTNQLLDKCDEKGRIEVIKDFALPLPVAVMSKLVGLDISDVDELASISRSLFRFSSSYRYNKASKSDEIGAG